MLIKRRIGERRRTNIHKESKEGQVKEKLTLALRDSSLKELSIKELNTSKSKKKNKNKERKGRKRIGQRNKEKGIMMMMMKGQEM